MSIVASPTLWSATCGCNGCPEHLYVHKGDGGEDDYKSNAIIDLVDSDIVCADCAKKEWVKRAAAMEAREGVPAGFYKARGMEFTSLHPFERVFEEERAVDVEDWERELNEHGESVGDVSHVALCFKKDYCWCEV